MPAVVIIRAKLHHRPEAQRERNDEAIAWALGLCILDFSVLGNSSQEGPNFGADFGGMGLQSKMSRVVEDNLGAGIVATIGLGAGWEKERIVFSPNRESRRTMRAEVFLELRVKCDVAFVVPNEVELNLGTLRAIQQGLVQDDGLRRNELLRIGHPMMILPASGFQGRKAAQDIAVLLGRIFPVGADGSPVLAQTFFVGVPVLGNECRNPLRVVQGQTQPGGGAIVEDVDGKLVLADLLREFPDDLGQMFKRVSEAFVIRRVRETEAGQIGCNHVILPGQLRNQIAEHVA
jgi:hypothetical protein